MNCRHCGNKLKNLVIDLGSQPPSNSYLNEIDLKKKKLIFLSKFMYVQIAFLCRLLTLLRVKHSSTKIMLTFHQLQKHGLDMHRVCSKYNGKIFIEQK